MSRKLLVLEPSQTMQAIFVDKTKKADFEFSFDTNGIRFLVTLYNSLPDVVLINARNMNPMCVDLVHLIKSVARFADIPVGVYATSDFIFEEEFLKSCGADMFINFDEKKIVNDLEELFAKKHGKLALPERNNIVKSGITHNIFSMIEKIDSIKDISEGFLNLIVDFAQIPAATIFFNLEDGAEGYYICGENFTEDEKNDFLKVCLADFENLFPKTNFSKLKPLQLKAKKSMNQYHSAHIPISAYQMIPLVNKEGNKIASVHMVKEGSFANHQIDLITYAGKQLERLLDTAVNFRGKLKFEKNVRKAFSRFVPAQIIDELVSEAESEKKIGVGEKRDVAILFSDIRSFTSISESNKPETIVAFLNRYFTIMCKIIQKYGGTVDKFIGDAIMAIFGAPVSYEDNARRAVCAAYEMREALESVPLEDLVLPADMKFNIGIGIHYGDVIVGSIGSDDKTDYSVIGDSVNLASRLEGLTKTYGTMILVSEATKDDIGESDFVFRHLDDVKVKGKEKAVPIFAIDRSMEEFSSEYRDSYIKGFSLYKQGIFNLAKEYFEKALKHEPEDKASMLMLERCKNFIKNPPESWDGAIAFNTK